ncbi:DUF305 domain-containing protein [Pleurocapsales cyanobacterium LEGE 06147]|nr:DUF305 domain-containing protein [Pleurocapsales cyanobacterium LEGE 06147]
MQIKSLKTSALVSLAFMGVSFLTIACSTATSNSTPGANSPAVSEAKGDPSPTSQHGDMMEHHDSMNHERSMDWGPADAEYDLRFIDAMVLHHQGAINMAQEVLQHSQRPEMKELAQEIIAAQEQEIEQMKQWRKAWYSDASDTPQAWQSEINHMMPMTEEMMQSMMMSMDLGKADTEFDLRFIDGMIPHHEGALEMARDALSKSERPEIQQLSQDILTSQQQEIDQMKQWREDWYK